MPFWSLAASFSASSSSIGLGGALDQADDVAHAEDAAGDALGVELLERVDLLAGADEDDRLAGDRAHRQGGAAARVAVDPGQDDAGDADALAERLGDIDRVLPGHRVGDEERLVRVGRLAHRRDLEHQLLVDVEPAGGVEQHDVVALGAAHLQRAPGDRDRALAGDDRQGRDADLPAELGELLLGGRALHVEPGHQHLFPLAGLEPERDLRRGRRLAGALQPDQHDRDRRGRVEVEPAIGTWPARLGPAEHLDEMVVDDLDDHLAGRDRAHHLLADRLLAHRGDEIAHHRQRDIGFQERDADLAQGRGDIVLAERAAPAQPVENLAETIAEGVEHAAYRGSNALRAGARHSRTGRLPVSGGLQHSCRKRARTLVSAPVCVNCGGSIVMRRVF